MENSETVRFTIPVLPVDAQTRPKGGERHVTPAFLQGCGRKLRQNRERVAASKSPAGLPSPARCQITDRADNPGQYLTR